MKRARDDADRDRRRGAILHAADTLLRRGGGTLPPVAAIASEAALAKGTVYLYFDTREEIFLSLLKRLWDPVFASFGHELVATERPLLDRTTAFADWFAAYCRDHVHLLRLDAILKEVIERNVSARNRAEYRDNIALLLSETGHQLDTALALPAGKGFRTVLRVHALMRGLWQSFGNAVPELPEMTFETELREAVAEYLVGALKDAVPGRPGC